MANGDSPIGSRSSFFGQPAGLSTLFFTEMWERFSYYGMRAILVLFMTTDVAQKGLGLTEETSGAIYGLYTAGVYLLTLPGGWLADNIFGQQKAIWYGGILIMIGHILLAFAGFEQFFPAGSGASQMVFFIGLAFIAGGTGLLKPNISTIVGDLYPEGGARRDAGFSIFYMGINLGSLLGQTAVAYVGEKVDWHLGFGLAAIGMLLGLIQYRSTIGTLKGIGEEPKAKLHRQESGEKTNPAFAIGISVFTLLFLVVLQMIGWIDVTSARGLAEAVGIIIITVTISYFLYILVAGGLVTDEKKKVVIIFLLFLGAAFFWAGFEQAGSTLNLFSRDYTDRSFFGLFGDEGIPAGWLQNVNPLMIVIFAPVIGALWVRLATRNMNPSTPLKFGFGLILMAVGFYVMVVAANLVVANYEAGTAAKVGMGYLVLTYFLHSIGELTLSPVGLSATTKLAPKRYMGQMMGIWFVGAALGNLIAGLFAGEFDIVDPSPLPGLFMTVVYLGLGAGIFFIIFSKPMRNWMGDVH